jgi:hypothetical protein
MAGKIILRVVAAFVLVAAVVVIAAFAYYAGTAHPVVQGAQAPAAAGSGPYLYFGWPFFPFFGWGLFGLLIPLFILCIVFGAIRRLIWGGPYWGHMHRRHWGGPFDGNGEGVPPMVAEWHRRLHEEPKDDAAKK